MTQQNIDVFLAVAQNGSISAAAQALFITQPAVSRHIQELEKEVGCPLFKRGKGIRHIQLTEQGERFVLISKKWKQLLQETREIAYQNQKEQLRIAAVESVSTYLLASVLQKFWLVQPQWSIRVHNYHSLESYYHIDNGLIDLAIISDDMHFGGVETIPLFREPMVLVTHPYTYHSEKIHPSQLDPALEIRLPWNPEYDMWHDIWFHPAIHPKAFLDQMDLLETFLSWGNGWCIMPISVAQAIEKTQQIALHTLEEGPPPRIIYYLQGQTPPKEKNACFLQCIKEELYKYPQIDCLI